VEVTDPEDELRDSKKGDKEVKLWGLNGGGRQENSLRTSVAMAQLGANLQAGAGCLWRPS